MTQTSPWEAIVDACYTLASKMTVEGNGRPVYCIISPETQEGRAKATEFSVEFDFGGIFQFELHITLAERNESGQQLFQTKANQLFTTEEFQRWCQKEEKQS